MRIRTDISLALVIVCWGIVVGMGMAVVLAYSNEGRVDNELPRVWPDNCSVARAKDRHTLIMFLHPHCPCSRASVRQLARLLANCRSPLDVRVCFYQPDSRPAQWVRSDLWDAAACIPNVTVCSDRNGDWASRFGVTTSGHALLFDPCGELVFSGGITAGRGHEGDNLGSSAILALLAGSPASQTHCPVFGCPIHQVTVIGGPSSE